VISRTDKHFIIKVSKIRLIDKRRRSIRIANSKDYNEKVKNTIILSIKQGMKLLLDNNNSYENICDKLYYKFGRLMISQ